MGCLRRAAASIALLAIALVPTRAQSVARVWNEQLLEAIRDDFARPTVHARNLYHFGLAVHDAYAAYDQGAPTFFLGRTTGAYANAFAGAPTVDDVRAAREEAISYAAYRLLRYRFREAPGRREIRARIDSVMGALGYPTAVTGEDYATGSPAALGNYLAAELIRYGQQDGANDAEDYANLYYEALNPPLLIDQPGNPDIVDPDRWQPLALTRFVDQSGNPIPGGQQAFLGPEWGNVDPFALGAADRDGYVRDGDAYNVYLDPGPPPSLLDAATREEYQRNFELVAIWGGLLDAADGELVDVSPASDGRYADPLPPADDYLGYYREYRGGDTTGGLGVNPVTGEGYAPNLVPRGDYTRVLAEFWADGPDSETPPGHWFTLLNYVMDQPGFERRWRGRGDALDALAYDVRAYLTLGGAMHDAAVATWSVKGYYDYVRPVSAIRYMAERGQRSDPAGARYDPLGLRIEPGHIEQITDPADPLAGDDGEFLGEMKLYSWRGPTVIDDPAADVAGVGWVRAKEWWPYQRPTFVSPPFAGYVSGHSTYSRAAAEVLTAITGSEYFPGGLGRFRARADDFLVFERGPSVDVELQWATYRDASDEVSLSRIYGGIHPPVDDIPGRRIGVAVAERVVAKTDEAFGVLSGASNAARAAPERLRAYPNPVSDAFALASRGSAPAEEYELVDALGRVVRRYADPAGTVRFSVAGLPAGRYVLHRRSARSPGYCLVTVE